MKKTKRMVVDFLRNYGMDHSDIGIDDHIAAFLDEMEKGLAGKKSSLEMIPTYIGAAAPAAVNKRVIAIDAGGTNFRVAAVYFDRDARPVIEKLSLYKMPGVQRRVGRNEFFRIMAGFLKDVADASDSIGFCFSYAVAMQPNRDGRAIRFSKEIKAPGVIGQLVGENLNRAMAATGGGNKKIVILNDTVATLLAGCGHQGRMFDGYIGFILGTGTNCCYIEKNKNIGKTAELNPSAEMIINTESGGFDKCRRGRLDTAFDKTTAIPCIQKLEKMISGAYLGPLCLSVMHRACRDGLFSPPAAAAIRQMAGLETKQMNDFMLYPCGDNPLAAACRTGDDNDAAAACCIADRLIERAAKFTAITLSAMAIKSGGGTNPARPICIVAEGTTFYQMKTLRPRVEFYLKQYLENRRGIYTEIINVENAALIGAAIAGLTN